MQAYYYVAIDHHKNVSNTHTNANYPDFQLAPLPHSHIATCNTLCIWNEGYEYRVENKTKCHGLKWYTTDNLNQEEKEVVY